MKYCKHCGKQIDDDSTFCIHCGKSLVNATKTKIVAQNATATVSEAETTTNRPPAFLPILLLIIIAIGFYCIFTETPIHDIVSLSRDLNRNDYSYTTDQGVTSYRVTIVPNSSIKNCAVQLTLYNSKGEIVYSDTITKTDLRKGNSYTYTFDFGISGALEGSKVSINITGKCPLFASSTLITNTTA